jgi:hypothetical protein
MIQSVFVAGIRNLSTKSKTMLTKTAIQSTRYAGAGVEALDEPVV